MPITSVSEKVPTAKDTGLLRPPVLSDNSVKPVKRGTTTFPLGRLLQVLGSVELRPSDHVESATGTPWGRVAVCEEIRVGTTIPRGEEIKMTLLGKLIVEAIGTFFLVFTVGQTVVGVDPDRPLRPWHRWRSGRH